MKKLLYLSLCSTLFLFGCNNTINNNNINNKQYLKNQPPVKSLNNTKEAKDFLIKKYGLPEDTEVSFLESVNLYQVFVRGEVTYLTKDNKYLVTGHLISTLDNKDFTQEYLDNKNIINIKNLPLNLAIKNVKGRGENVIYVFSDPDCPYCHLFNITILPYLDNVTVYTFLTPLSSIHPNADSDSLKILCSKNQSSTLDKWLNVKPDEIDSMRNKILPNDTLCLSGTNTLNNLKQLANKLNINGTPTIFNKDGKQLKLTSPLEFKQNVESK